jgi:hypothetical protein
MDTNMKNEHEDRDEAKLEIELKRRLRDIRDEKTPERLLWLARRLQQVLRARSDE